MAKNKPKTYTKPELIAKLKEISGIEIKAAFPLPNYDLTHRKATHDVLAVLQ